MHETKANTGDWADAHFVDCLFSMQDVNPWVQPLALHRTSTGDTSRWRKSSRLSWAKKEDINQL